MAARDSGAKIVWLEGDQYEVTIGDQAKEVPGITGQIFAAAGTGIGIVIGGVLSLFGYRPPSPPPPQRFKCTIRCTRGHAIVNCICHCTLSLQTYEGAVIKACNVLRIAASLRCIHDDSITYCNICQNSPQFRSSERVIFYIPKTRGRHELTVTVMEERIRGSPFTTFVEVPPTSLGEPTRIIRGVTQPTSLAIGPNSECVVVETSANRVSVFNSNGEKIKTIRSSSQGWTFDTPSGVSIDSSGNIYVIDRQKVSKFSPMGQPIKSYPWQHPAGIAAFPGISSVDDQLYVYNIAGNEIMRLAPELTAVLERFTASMESEILEPRNVQSDGSGGTVRSFVRPRGDRRMQRHTQEETNVTSYAAGKTFHKAGVVPCGMFVDTRAGLVYVTDTNKSQVVIFRSSGECEYVHSFGSKGREPGQFVNPTGIDVDVDGFVYVCDSGNDRVQIF